MEGRVFSITAAARRRLSGAGMLARCCLLMLALLGTPAIGEPRYFFEAVEPNEGPIQNSIRAVIQDRNGFLWVGTDSGLQRYDGYNYRPPMASRGSAGEALQGIVLSLAEDSRQRIWAGMWGDGLWRLDPVSGDRIRPDLPDLRDRSVQMLRHIDGEGLWIGAMATLFQIETDQGALIRRIEIPAGEAAGVRIRDVVRQPDGSHWIATNRGIFRDDGSDSPPQRIGEATTGDIHATVLGSDGRLYIAADKGLFALDHRLTMAVLWSAQPGNAAISVAEPSPGKFWLGLAAGGLRIIDMASGSVSNPDRADGLPGTLPPTVAEQLMVDRSGLLWMGTTTRGLLKVDPAGARFDVVADSSADRNPITANNIFSLHEDAAGSLWIGTIGGGLKRLSPDGSRSEDFNPALRRAFDRANSTEPFTIRGIGPAGADRLWVSSDYGVAELDPRRNEAVALPALPDNDLGFVEPGTGPLLVTRDGTLWVCNRGSGNRGNLVASFDRSNRRWKPHILSQGDGRVNLCLSLAEDAKGNVWAGSLHGVHRIDIASGDVRTFSHDPARPASLSNNVVRALHVASDGSLWAGTQAGLNHLLGDGVGDPRYGQWSAEPALRNHAIGAILEDDRQRIWLGTNRGLVSVDRDTGKAIGSSLRDGLVSMDFRAAAAIRLASGELAFGGLNGINRFNPGQISGSAYAAPVVITEVRIGNQPGFQPGSDSTVQILDNEPVIQIDFAALDYAAPRRNRFWYRLAGFESDWIDAGTRNSVAYTHLDPGRYTFQVRGSNRDGVISDSEAKLAVEVTGPWWTSTLARTLFVGLVLVALLQAWRVVRRRRSLLSRHNTQLLERENRLRMALWGSGDQFWDWDVRRGLLTRTSSETLTGDKRVQDIPIDVWQGQVHPDDVESLRQRMIEHVEGRSDTYESEHRLREGDDWRWVLARGRVVERDSNGHAVRVSGTSRDITQSRLAEQDRRIARQVLHDMDEAVMVFDLDFNVASINPAFTRMTGWHDDDIIGQSTRLLDCSQHDLQHYERIRAELAQRGRWNGELWQRRSDGTEFSSWTQLNEVRDANGLRTHYVGVVSDITERKRSEQELRYLANYDMLTGLPNRSLLSERLARAIRQNPQGAIGIVYLDLDRFKHVNDSFGHATGDRLLKAAGDRLRQIVERNDTVSRLGGDEFTIVLENLGSRSEAEAVARRVLGAFAQPIDLGDAGTVTITPSIGISLYPDHGDNVAELLKYADTAMYQAKEGGRNTFMVYTEAMDLAARERATLIAALRKAVERKEFRLVFQPRLSLTHWRLTAVEALLRWNSADVGEIGPTQFIPIAEDTGLIIEIGEWVLRETCAQIARWRSDGIRGLTVSINVSMLQLQRGNVAERLTALLDEFAIPADQIELELTESVVMANAEQSIGILQQLRDVGVTLSIDDFGTGYSSLSYLKRLPIDTLKIDKAFVGDITTDPDDRAITATIIAMAQSLGLNVVAEGVETAAQIEFLREHHCDEIQGYWLSPPLPPDECHAFLQEHLQRRNRMLGSV